jgi:FAD-dependent urate hydroxylase
MEPVADHTDLLVIGAGPYAYSAAAFARDNGISTRIVGRPMAFWRDHMPGDMFLRSGPDWHLDGSGVDTFEAFFEDRGLDRADHDPIPISVFLDYTDWFAQRKGLAVEERMVEDLTRPNGEFRAEMDDGGVITARRVLAAPGIAHYAALPDWYEAVPADRRSHSSELIRFDRLAGARVVVVGGRQSAYEWAALLCDHGAERVDVVHRHDTPDFARVSWAFVNDYVEQTLATRGWWRRLPATDQQAIASRFWQVGRLTLEHWLVPRLDPKVVHQHPRCEVVSVDPDPDSGVRLTLSDGETADADHVVFASGYRADLARVPYLSGVLDQVSVTDGFPDLSEGLETSLPGLYVVGFSATRDFGPFYGFTKGCPSAARIAVADMLGWPRA